MEEGNFFLLFPTNPVNLKRIFWHYVCRHVAIARRMRWKCTNSPSNFNLFVTASLVDNNKSCFFVRKSKALVSHFLMLRDENRCTGKMKMI